jgi:hypothetical protein
MVTIIASFELMQSFPIDVNVFILGAVQINALEVDMRSTLENYYEEVYLNRETLLNIERDFLIEHQIDFILTDATALACTAGTFDSISFILYDMIPLLSAV